MAKKLHSKITQVWKFECKDHTVDEPYYSEYFISEQVAGAWLVAHDMRYHGVR